MNAQNPEGIRLELLEAFAGSTGIGCRYLPAGGDMPCGGCAGFCEHLQQNRLAMGRCVAFMELAGQQAAYLGEPYTARCHAGLIEIGCAVLRGRERAGTLLCGPVLLWERDELAAEEMLTHLRGLDVDRHRLFVDYFDLSVFTPKRLAQTARLLSVLADSLGMPDLDFLTDRQRITRQQMRVADDIILRKKTEENRKERSARVGVYPLNKERELLGRVRLGDRNGARRILNELLALIFYDTAGNLDITKARVLELVVVISRAAVESGAELTQLLGYDYTFLPELSRQASFEEVCAWVVRMLDAFIDAVYSTRSLKSSRYLGGVIEYLQEHFAENITLEDAAALVPISPYYLSHLFREELGMTFLEYLTRIRIDKAKSLLNTTSLHIQDVAARVGYDDAGYFAKVFRKSVSVTPGKYRKYRYGDQKS